MEQGLWKKNLGIAWVGNFLTGASISLVMPFISLFVEDLGVPKGEVAVYAGLAVSTTALAAAIMAPIWGALADSKGRKIMMLRSSGVMMLTMGGLAFIANIWWLLALRLLTGIFAGYVPNATALIASQVPKDKTGYALGTLSTGVVAGTLLGPLLGGFLADLVGMRAIFLLVGFLFLVVTLLTWFGIEEEVQQGPEKVVLSTTQVLAKVKDKQVLFGLLVTSLVINAAAQSVVPILTLYVRHLGQVDNLLFVSGLITSAVGISSMMSSAYLGKLGDRIGNHRLLVMALAYSFMIHLLFTQARTPLQLGLIRFFYGFGTGALLPSLNSLLTKITPKEGISRIFAYNQTFGSLGVVLGPTLGSGVATLWGYEWVFYVTSLLVLFNLIWSLIYFRPYMKVKEIA